MPTASVAFNEALTSWARVLGSSNVVRDPESLTRAETATFATDQRVLTILRPADRDEVQDCVRIANRFRVPLYPISSGRNWGYGSRVPAEDGVLLDLGRLNRIVEFDEDLAYVTIEPGVTQRQLFAFLRERRSRLWMDATGAGPDCSVIGNTLERGFGHTPMGNHCANVSGFEVVLPTGEAIETGFSRFTSGQTGPVSRWGVGPSLDGLFAQSNLGIVTRMSVWLMPAPECFQAFFFLSRDEDGLAGIVDALRPLRLDGTLRSVMHVVNDFKVLTSSGQRPPEASNGPLNLASVRRLRKGLGIGAWNGSGGLYGTRAQVREARRLVRKALRGKVHKLQFVNDRLLRMMARFAGPFRFIAGWDVRRTLDVLEPAYNLLKGVPTDATLASSYWPKPGGAPEDKDPDRDRCGLLWCSPVIPNSGPHAAEVTALAARTLLDRGFEPQMSLSLATERSAICIITISYDRELAGEDGRAHACYRDLTEQLLARGYPPYRLNVSSMHYLSDDEVYPGTLAAIKSALDPNRVLAPGRYEPDGARAAAVAGLQPGERPWSAAG